MSATVAVTVVDRLRALIEAALPWYDVEAERRQRLASEAQMAASRSIRAKATRAIHASRKDRAMNGYRAYARRVAR